MHRDNDLVHDGGCYGQERHEDFQPNMTHFGRDPEGLKARRPCDHVKTCDNQEHEVTHHVHWETVNKNMDGKHGKRTTSYAPTYHVTSPKRQKNTSQPYPKGGHRRTWPRIGMGTMATGGATQLSGRRPCRGVASWSDLDSLVG